MTLQLFSYPSQPYDNALVAKAAQFANDKIRPFAEQWERERVQPEAVLRTAVSQAVRAAYQRSIELGKD